MFKRKGLWQLGVAFVPTLVLVVCLLAWQDAVLPVQAQGSIVVDKQLGRASNVVYVGEYITFTISIDNRSGMTVTKMPLYDEYNNSVLRFVDATVGGYVDHPVTGTVTWADLTTALGDFPPGRVETIIVGFIAEHPQSAVVNFAEVRDAESDLGAIGGGGDESDDAESVGGAAPVEKTLMDGLNPQVGDLLTYTIVVTNDGYVTMTLATLVDTYDPEMLMFYDAVPMPDVADADTGTLTWNNLTDYFGDIPAHGAVTIMTVFMALQASDSIVNQAQTVAAGDWYGNDMAGGADLVPIVVVERPATPTPETPTPRARPQNTPTPAPTATPTPTVTPTLTPTPFVVLLPASGPQVPPGFGWMLVLGVALLLLLLIPSKTWRRP